MTALMMFYAVFFPVLLGCVPLSLLLRKKDDAPFYLRYALGWGLGTILLTRSMPILSFFGVKLSVLSITLFWLPFLALIGVFSVYRKYEIFDLPGLVSSFGALVSFLKDRGRAALFEKTLFGLLIFKITYVFYEALIKPVYAWDAWGYWVYMGKVFFVERAATPAVAMLTRGYDQPWHVSLLNAWMFLNFGYFNDVLSEIIYPMYFLSFILIMYFALRLHLPRLSALFYTYLVTTLPFYLYHATISYADSLVSFYACTAFVLIFLYFERRIDAFLVLAFLFSIFSVLVKKQGVLYFSSLSLVSFVYILKEKPAIFGMEFKKYIRPFLICLGLLLIEMLNILIMALMRKEVWIVPYFDRVPVILKIFSDKLFFMGNWNILWFAFIVVSILALNKEGKTSLVYTFSAAALNLGLLFLFFLFGSDVVYIWLRDGTVLNRYFVQFSPFVVLYIAYAARSVFEAGTEVKTQVRKKR